MLVGSIKPVLAGEVRNKHYLNPFDTHIGIEKFEASGQGVRSTANTHDTTSNIHGSVHGGWSSANLDATSVGAAYFDKNSGLKDDEFGITASLDVRFLKPAMLGRKYICDAEVISREGNNIQTKAVIKDSETLVEIASATGLVKARKLDFSSLPIAVA